jgi:hypothetical protein
VSPSLFPALQAAQVLHTYCVGDVRADSWLGDGQGNLLRIASPESAMYEYAAKAPMLGVVLTAELGHCCTSYSCKRACLTYRYLLYLMQLPCVRAVVTGEDVYAVGLAETGRYSRSNNLRYQ